MARLMSWSSTGRVFMKTYCPFLVRLASESGSRKPVTEMPGPMVVSIGIRAAAVAASVSAEMRTRRSAVAGRSKTSWSSRL